MNRVELSCLLVKATRIYEASRMAVIRTGDVMRQLTNRFKLEWEQIVRTPCYLTIRLLVLNLL